MKGITVKLSFEDAMSVQAALDRMGTLRKLAVKTDADRIDMIIHQGSGDYHRLANYIDTAIKAANSD